MLDGGYLRFCLWQNERGQYEAFPQDSPPDTLSAAGSAAGGDQSAQIPDARRLAADNLQEERDACKTAAPSPGANSMTGAASSARAVEVASKGQGVDGQNDECRRGAATGKTSGIDEARDANAGGRGGEPDEAGASERRSEKIDEEMDQAGSSGGSAVETQDVETLEKELRRLREQVDSMEAGGDESGAALERGDKVKKKRRRKRLLGEDGSAPPRLSESERAHLVAEARREVALVRAADPPPVGEGSD